MKIFCTLSLSTLSALFIPFAGGFGCSHWQRAPAQSEVAQTRFQTAGPDTPQIMNQSPGSSPQSASLPNDPSMASWIVMGPKDSFVIRTVLTSTHVCPTITVDQGPSGEPKSELTAKPLTKIPMTIRAAPNSNFPVTVCEAMMSGPTSGIRVGGQLLPAVPRSPRKILVFGDTGCRIKDQGSGKIDVQACNDPNQWPFAKPATIAASLKPDLVVHVGDYHYRETACPVADSAQCDGSVYGDVWSSWSQDFFQPASPLLSAAPWIFVRGNHEDCARAHEGFFRFLDPRTLSDVTPCQDVSAPYVINFSSLQFAVLDSSQADINAAAWGALANTELFNGSWLVTHRPPWVSVPEAVKGDDDGDDDDNLKPRDATALKPVGPGPAQLSLVINGHRHLLRAMSFEDHRAPEITVGNGGTALESNPTDDKNHTGVDGNGTTLRSIMTRLNWGFTMFESIPHTSDWRMEAFGPNGQNLGSCRLKAQKEASPFVLDCANMHRGSKVFQEVRKPHQKVPQLH